MTEEEARTGWVLLEKFDDKRLRFKRPMSARRKDAMLSPDVDPYRTNYGISNDTLGAFIALGVLVLFLTGQLQ